MLNAKQGSRKYQRLESFGLTRPGNRTQVYRLRGTRSNNATVHVIESDLFMFKFVFSFKI